MKDARTDIRLGDWPHAQEGRHDIGAERAPEERAATTAETIAALTVRSRLLEVVADVSTLLARSADFPAAVAETLCRVGEAAGLSRVALFEERARSPQGPYDHVVVNEWCVPGVRTHAQCGTDLIPSADAEQFLDRLRRGESFWLQIDEVAPPAASRSITASRPTPGKRHRATR